MSNTVLSNLYQYISDSMTDELQTIQSTFYGFIGKTTPPTVDEQIVKDNLTYDSFIRDNLVYAKKIPISDIGILIDRYNWTSGITYDMYDDTLHGSYVAATQINNGGTGYVDGSTFAYVVGGGGINATLTLSIVSGVIIGVGIVDAGMNYTSTPSVTIIDSTGTGQNADIEVVMSSNTLSNSGAYHLRHSRFYVLTTDNNVYKCLYNNLNLPSTVMPSHTSVDPYTTSDGYKWKFLYHIELGTRRKFLTASFMPVYNVLTSSYYGNGAIDYVEITNGGINYAVSSPLKLYVSGDGISGNFLGKIDSITKEISSVEVLNSGVDYSATTTKLLHRVVCVAGVATLTTDTAHNLVVGKSFTLSGTGGVIDGTYIVASSTSNTVITFNASPIVTIAPTIFANIGTATSHTLEILTVTRLDNVVTVVTNDVNNLNKGNIVTLTGISEGGGVFDGTYTVDEYINSTTFAFNQFGVNEVVPTTAGIISLPIIGILDAARDAGDVVTISTLSVHNFKAPFTIDTIVRTTGVVTVKTDNNNYYLVGDTIAITGAAAGFLGEFAITNVINLKEFEYTHAGADASDTTGYVKNWVVVAGAGGFDSAGVTVDSVPDSKSFTFSQAGATVVSTVPQKMIYNTTIALSSNSPVSGKYGTNSEAVLAQNLLVKNGIGYTGIPLIHIHNTLAPISKTTVVAGTAISAQTVTIDKWALYRLTIILDGTITVTPAAGNATGYASEALAIAALPTIDPTSVDMGYITLKTKSGTTFVAGTDALAGGTGGNVASITNYYPNTDKDYIIGCVLSLGSTNQNIASSAFTYYLGGGATADAVVAGNKVTQINMTNSGSGYISEPEIYFNGGGTEQATATANLTLGVISSYTVSPGSGYSSAPKVFVVDPTGIGATATAIVYNGEVTGISVVTGGTGYTSPVVYFTGTSDYCCSATAILYDGIVNYIQIDSTIDSIAITDPGIGYDDGLSTIISINGDGIGAELTPIILDGSIVSVIVSNAGEGYSYADLTVTGIGTNATLRASLNATNLLGQVNTSQYNSEVLAVAGAIDAIVVTNGGAVTGTVVVTITGDGSDATATAKIVNNIITEIIVDNRGAGYTHAIVTITGAGTSASARAILPPHGGHGYNALTELYGTNVAVYTKIRDVDIYNSFNFTNEFYQYGVICNPQQYDSTIRCSANIISPCVSVAGTFSLADFALNDIVIIVVGSVNKSFRIVDITATTMLLQAIDVYLPLLGEKIYNVAFSKNFTITAVINPSMSLQSGIVVDINNTNAFYKTPSQIILLRTLFTL